MEPEAPQLSSYPAVAHIPLALRLQHEIPKPKDHQVFQRNCVLLYRADFGDPNAQEYGRNGQGQGGIDILGKRNGDPTHYVGVQCRRIDKPLKFTKILRDCRDTLSIKADLKEIIFATTAQDDRAATDAAVAAEQELRSEGRNISVSVHGWQSMQTLIARHDIAYAAFFPAAVAIASIRPASISPGNASGCLASNVATQVIEQLQRSGYLAPFGEQKPEDAATEDPALHGQIDAYRDLFKVHGQPVLAEKGLLELLKLDTSNKPWARFRIETNLGSIVLCLGRELEAAAHYEAAHAIRPTNSQAITNLALARTIRGKFDEAMALAQQALNMSPRDNHAVAFLLQAAARSTWAGDPQSLIPADLVGTSHADLGLAEFLRRREILGWEGRSLEIARRHADMKEFQIVFSIAVLSLGVRWRISDTPSRTALSAADISVAADYMKEFVQHQRAVGFANRFDQIAHINNACGLLRLCNRDAEAEQLLRSASDLVSADATLRRLHALCLISLKRVAEGISLLEGDTDAENRLLRAELVGQNNPAAALDQVLAIDPPSSRLAVLRWRLAGDLAVKIDRADVIGEAAKAIEALDPGDPEAELLLIRADQKSGLAAEKVQLRLLTLARKLPASANLLRRFRVASDLVDQGLPEEAANLLENEVDLSHVNPPALLYLRSLAESRRDNAFLAALSRTSDEVRDDPDVLWMTAAHSWNVGNIERALVVIDKLLVAAPDDARAVLFKIESLFDQNHPSCLDLSQAVLEGSGRQSSRGWPDGKPSGFVKCLAF